MRGWGASVGEGARAWVRPVRARASALAGLAALATAVTGVAIPGAVAGQVSGAGRSAELAGDAAPRLEARIERAGPEGHVVILDVPGGWSLYAADPGEAGLPLRLAWVRRGGTETLRATDVRADYPEPEVGTSAGLLVRSYTGTVRIPVAAPADPTALRALRVEWALCRADLCVPGVSEVAWEVGVPHGGSG